MNVFRSNKLRSQLKKVLYITIAWTIISLIQYFNVYSIFVELDVWPEMINARAAFAGSILKGILAGLLGGSALVFLWDSWLQTKNYALGVLYIILTFTAIFVFVSVAIGLFYTSRLHGLAIYEPELWSLVFQDLTGLSTLKHYLFWLFVVDATHLVMLVNDKYGPGMFRDFMMGKYFRPKREERIFMFLDLRSSTTIAERLGEERYFNFIKDVFKDATPGIVYTKGEIYQYVGDEIVISWKTDEGIRNASCIRCFYEIQRILRQKAPYYEATYGVSPEFKAGLHYGHVMAGEIGVIKRDIAFSGDVLNTTARIQSKCNELGVNILLSKPLLDQLALPPNTFIPQKIGNILLRGKRQEVTLFTV
ncbi:adenylate/guanylate cyclase domain-containing protein [Flavilitoribacter nigricans]|uniref:Adenylate cyclase n=1 Tax=Flavilitoribacter nigricans (strain ATCC 23147 / DSM 23189 / NBRC 102662 / NCIMB 1420 / SS-2) TaxID=1122177 RepID=A0A2D0NEB4_FLAN2|nr:adenylate/guanylate cyclase domain-containing protein [Flavilitoribacter nigricans]PHN06716.1 adenylate cyclase [Flavilitoribacter nigricans DSM 23189 = NBRC 102662]